MEDGDSDAEMADYGTDFSDDVDPNFDAEAYAQQGSTVEIRAVLNALLVELGAPLAPRRRGPRTESDGHSE